VPAGVLTVSSIDTISTRSIASLGAISCWNLSPTFGRAGIINPNLAPFRPACQVLSWLTTLPSR
jgi:hypothetical protein